MGTTREMSFWSGDAQRLNSSSCTSLALVFTTIWGRSTVAGMVTGPTATDTAFGDAVAPVAVPVRV